MTEHSDSGLLIVGGHRGVTGGLEIFIARARACLRGAAIHHTETPMAGGWRNFVAALAGFPAAMAGRKIVWLHYGSLFDLAFLPLAKLFGRTVAVTPHLGGHWRSQRSTVLRTLSNRLLLLADAVFTLYGTQGEDLRFPAALKRRCTPMPTLLPQEVLHETPRTRAPGPLRLIHAARLSAAKGSFAFIDTCAALAAKGIAFEATMIGPVDAETRNSLDAAIKTRDLQDRLRIAPPVPPEAMADVLHRFDVLVNLSLQDAYPLTVLEALGCGLCVVCTALPGTTEMAAAFPAVRTVTGQDAQAAARIVEAAAPPVAADLSSRFGWPVVAARYRAAFDALTRKIPQTAYRKATGHEKHL